LSDVALDLLANGLAKRQILKGVFFSHLGTVPTVDQIPLFADFGLQAEGVEWSVVSGVVGSDLHISVRNVGYVKSAGDVTRAAFGDLGSAGGHRTMAKAVVPVRVFMKGAGDSAPGRASQERIIQRFLKALGQQHQR
jgi:nanoRNase/pAp phosphatase (c-di-AMP/oligoRNAs hydrolase)